MSSKPAAAAVAAADDAKPDAAETRPVADLALQPLMDTNRRMALLATDARFRVPATPADKNFGIPIRGAMSVIDPVNKLPIHVWPFLVGPDDKQVVHSIGKFVRIYDLQRLDFMCMCSLRDPSEPNCGFVCLLPHATAWLGEEETTMEAEQKHFAAAGDDLLEHLLLAIRYAQNAAIEAETLMMLFPGFARAKREPKKKQDAPALPPLPARKARVALPKGVVVVHDSIFNAVAGALLKTKDVAWALDTPRKRWDTSKWPKDKPVPRVIARLANCANGLFKVSAAHDNIGKDDHLITWAYRKFADAPDYKSPPKAKDDEKPLGPDSPRMTEERREQKDKTAMSSFLSEMHLRARLPFITMTATGVRDELIERMQETMDSMQRAIATEMDKRRNAMRAWLVSEPAAAAAAAPAAAAAAADPPAPEAKGKAEEDSAPPKAKPKANKRKEKSANEAKAPKPPRGAKRQKKDVPLSDADIAAAVADLQREPVPMAVAAEAAEPLSAAAAAAEPLRAPVPVEAMPAAAAADPPAPAAAANVPATEDDF